MSALALGLFSIAVFWLGVWTLFSSPRRFAKGYRTIGAFLIIVGTVLGTYAPLLVR